MRQKSKSYEDTLIKSLTNPKEAAAYLSSYLDDSEPDSEELFLMALRDVAKAQGFSAVAAKANLGRESLYKALSPSGNPKLETLRSLLKAMGLKLTIVKSDDVA